MSNKNSVLLSVFKGILLTASGVVVVLLLQHYIFGLKIQPTASNQEIESRIKPLAKVAVAPLPKVSENISATTSVVPGTSNEATTTETNKVNTASVDKDLGKKTYDSICTGCHSSGALGAPKFGNKKDWAPRLVAGVDTLYQSALNGKNSMPARGGNPALTDSEVKAAVDYMVTASK